MKKTLPETIHIRITERDRQSADDFFLTGSCLVATALRRRGYSDINEGVDDCIIEGVCYRHEWFGCTEAHVNRRAKRKPYYGPGVVGKVLTLKRIKP